MHRFLFSYFRSSSSRSVLEYNCSYFRYSDESIASFDRWLKSGGVTTKLEICKSPTGSRGLMAKEEIKADDIVLSIPRSMIFYADHARRSALGESIDAVEELDDEAITFLFAISQRFDSTSSWKPFFDVLPTSFSTPIHFSFQELMQLDGSSMIEDTIESKEELRIFFEQWFPFLSNEHPKVFPSHVFTLDNFLWAR